MENPDSNCPDSNIAKIRQQARQLVRELDVVRGAYLGTGYTFSQSHVMFELSQHGPINLMEIADRLLIDKSNTSRTLKKLVQLHLVRATKVASDRRQKLFELTPEGKKAIATITKLADQQVQGAMANLSDAQQQKVIEGLNLYAEALRKSRLQSDCLVRPIKKTDNAVVAQNIRAVMTEFEAVGEGYSICDAEVDNMFAAYRSKDSCYFVVERNGQVLGGGGIGPLQGSKPSICELRKMFFQKDIRGIGMGRRLLQLLLDEARKRGYRQCYLETLDRMEQASKLYRKNGFKPLKGPVGNTGHGSCDRWYMLDL